MKLRISLGFLFLVLLPLQAEAGGYPLKANVGFSFNFAPQGYAPTPLGPWYLYWPLEAHFQTPAPLAYPYWSSAQAGAVGMPATSMGLPSGMRAAPSGTAPQGQTLPSPTPVPAPNTQPTPLAPGGPNLQPINYNYYRAYPTSPAPYYWYR